MRAAGAVLQRELHARQIVGDDDRLLLREAVVIELQVQPLIVADDVEAHAQAVARDHLDASAVARQQAAVGDLAEAPGRA